MIPIYILCAIIIYLIIDRQVDKYKCDKRSKDLLNRLMARDFAQYVQGTEKLEEQKKGKSLKDATSEDLVKEYEKREAIDPDILQVT
jgi:hypothetical protein